MINAQPSKVKTANTVYFVSKSSRYLRSVPHRSVFTRRATQWVIEPS